MCRVLLIKKRAVLSNPVAAYYDKIVNDIDLFWRIRIQNLSCILQFATLKSYMKGECYYG